MTRHVSVAGGVHGDAVALVKAVAAEIGGVDEGGACRVELRHEGVGLAAAEGRLEGPRRRWEVAGTSETRHVGVPHGVDGDAEALVTATALEVGGVGEHRVDDERPAPVVRRDLNCNVRREGHPLLRGMQRVPGARRIGGQEDIVSSHELFTPFLVLLVHERFFEIQVSAGDGESHVAIIGKPRIFGALEGELDLIRIRAGGHDEVVFQLALVPVVDQVNAGVNVLVLDLPVGGNVCVPLPGVIADEIVDDAG